MSVKKEFITYWSQEEVVAETSQMSLWKAKFFERTVIVANECHCVAMIPDNMPFDQMAVFAGKKTRVTIEVIE